MRRGKPKIKDAEEIALLAIRFAYDYPCCLCGAERQGGKCDYGYKNKGSCPVYKRIRHYLLPPYIESGPALVKYRKEKHE